jgi:hypothetical protein
VSQVSEMRISNWRFGLFYAVGYPVFPTSSGRFRSKSPWDTRHLLAPRRGKEGGLSPWPCKEGCFEGYQDDDDGSTLIMIILK